MVAVISVISQISIPMPSYIPLTFQIFAIALASYLLGFKEGIITVFIYVSLGAIGVPVFASFRGGIYVLFDYTGGFIWGFLIIAILCGISPKRKLAVFLGIISTLITHVLGVIWYSIIAKVDVLSAFIVVSLPYILKDILLIPVAYLIASKIKKHLQA
jgi:biotin transport system substrate-specific component